MPRLCLPSVCHPYPESYLRPRHHGGTDGIDAGIGCTDVQPRDIGRGRRPPTTDIIAHYRSDSGTQSRFSLYHLTHPALTMARDEIPADVKALIAQTVTALHGLAPPSAEFDDETQDAVFEAIDAIDDAMWDLNKKIHGASPQEQRKGRIGARGGCYSPDAYRYGRAAGDSLLVLGLDERPDVD